MTIKRGEKRGSKGQEGRTKNKERRKSTDKLKTLKWVKEEK